MSSETSQVGGMVGLTSAQQVRDQIAELTRHLREAPPHHGMSRSRLNDRLRQLEQRLRALEAEESAQRLSKSRLGDSA